jgi:hypothetical protein
MKKRYLLCVFLLATLWLRVSVSQAQVLLDDFNRADNGVVGNGWSEISTVIFSNQSRITAQALRIESGNASADFVYRDVSARYNTVFRSNSNVMTWAFNMRQTLANPNGFNSTSILAATNGIAFILGVNNSFLLGSPKGYAVVLGQPGKPDQIRLVRIKDEIGNSALINMIAGGDYSTEFLSVRVTYDPSTELWSLYTDASPSGFPHADPRQASTLIGTRVDNTYTDLSLDYLGMDWHHSNSPGNYAVFDDIYIPAPQPQVYTWNATTGNWSIPSNWTPARNTPLPEDILLFDGTVNASSTTTLDFPVASPQRVGQLKFINGAQATFTTNADRTIQLANNLSGDDFLVETGASLILTNSASAADVQINLPAGANAVVAGNLQFQGNNPQARHRLTALDAVTNSATGIRFTDGSIFTAGSNFEGNAFGAAAANGNTVRFENGAVYISRAGNDPFALLQPAAVTVFQAGSLYKHEQTDLKPALAGRTYGDFELNLPNPNAVCDMTEGSNQPGMIDNLTIRRGSLQFSLTNNLPQSLSIRNDLSVLPEGNFDYSPANALATSTLRLNGTSRQVISGGGSLLIGTYAELAIDNAGGVELEQDIGVNGQLRMNLGLLQTQTYLITMGPVATLSESETARVTGQIRTTRNLSQGVSYDFGGLGLEIQIQALGASPGSTTVTRVTGPTALRAIQEGTQSIQRFFTIAPAQNTGLNARLTFRYFDAEVAGEEAGLVLYRTPNQGNSWINVQGDLNAAANFLLQTELATLDGDWTAADDNAPLPVTLVSFGGRREGRNVRLEWRTASEINNAGFEVQRSTDLREFVRIGFVSAGTAQESTQSYTFSDNNQLKTSYYRLKQLDHNGQYAYSKAIFVNELSFASPGSLLVYPNPTQGPIHLSLPDKEEEIEVSLFSLQGVQLIHFLALPNEAETRLSRQLRHLSAGLYLLHISQKNQNFSTKLEKR